MWFEILPAAAIITVALSIPTYAMYGLHKLTLGNAYRRNMDERFDRVMYQRDFRLTNNPYIMNNPLPDLTKAFEISSALDSAYCSRADVHRKVIYRSKSAVERRKQNCQSLSLYPYNSEVMGVGLDKIPDEEQ